MYACLCVNFSASVVLMGIIKSREVNQWERGSVLFASGDGTRLRLRLRLSKIRELFVWYLPAYMHIHMRFPIPIPWFFYPLLQLLRLLGLCITGIRRLRDCDWQREKTCKLRQEVEESPEGKELDDGQIAFLTQIQISFPDHPPSTIRYPRRPCRLTSDKQCYPRC